MASEGKTAWSRGRANIIIVRQKRINCGTWPLAEGLGLCHEDWEDLRVPGGVRKTGGLTCTDRDGGTGQDPRAKKIVWLWGSAGKEATGRGVKRLQAGTSKESYDGGFRQVSMGCPAEKGGERKSELRKSFHCTANWEGAASGGSEQAKIQIRGAKKCVLQFCRSEQAGEGGGWAGTQSNESKEGATVGLQLLQGESRMELGRPWGRRFVKDALVPWHLSSTQKHARHLFHKMIQCRALKRKDITYRRIIGGLDINGVRTILESQCQLGRPLLRSYHLVSGLVRGKE